MSRPSAKRTSGGDLGEPGGSPRSCWALEKDLEREVDRATATQERDRVVQVDVMTRRQDERALGVVSRPLELLVTPTLDSIHLGAVQSFEFRRRHRSPPFASGLGNSFTRLFVHYDVSDVPFLGGFG